VGFQVKTEDVDFYNPHETLKREPGVYLDTVERVHAEEQRAIAENREPDFENMPAGVGTPLKTRSELREVPIGTAPAVYVTLPVALNSPDPADEDQQKAAKEASDGVAEQVYEARVERINKEAEAAKAAAENKQHVEQATADAENDTATALGTNQSGTDNETDSSDTDVSNESDSGTYESGTSSSETTATS
jgi:hypothetical protein